jgi:hypothetical protein
MHTYDESDIYILKEISSINIQGGNRPYPLEWKDNSSIA